ncbi:hypothetical protein [Brevundimonas sp.]|uniref:hypothetical protein n=1 Tax=Brevundimonas sp. TaxID=1871086 RepID=UPI0035AFD345
MPQDDDVTELDEIVVIGQRRPAGSSGAYGGGGGRGTGAPDQYEIDDDPNPQPDGPGYDPCATPEGALEWNADAAAAEAVREFQRRAAARTPPETLNTREWGAALFQMPDGSVAVGNITSGQYTFRNPGPGGRASVGIDWTAPAGGVLIGMVLAIMPATICPRDRHQPQTIRITYGTSGM